MPGLIRGVARTAVVAGTTTAVSNRVSRRQANKWSQQNAAEQQAQYDQQAQYAPPPQYDQQAQYAPPPQYDQQAQYAPPQYAQPAPPPVPVAAPDPLDQLQKLANLKNQGILTDAEFEAQKAKILAS